MKAKNQSSQTGTLRQQRSRQYGRLINILGRLYRPWAISLLLNKWYAAPKYPYTSREREIMTSATQGEMRFEGESLRYYHWGSEGPLILLIHGWSGHSAQMGGFVAPLVAAGFQILALDAPAHGQSSGSKTDLFAITRAWQQLLRGYPAPYGIISHSFGGVVSCYALSQQLIPCHKLVLISTPPSLEYLVDGYCRVLKLGDPLQQGFKAALAQRYGGDIWQEVAPLHTAPGLTLPTLICHDRDDRVLPVSIAEQLCAALPHGRCLISEKRGHRRILSASETIKNVIAFIKDC
jgi:pimeloyl-ACP methyl ester carboxylesterase